jgi:hypothetical protein
MCDRARTEWVQTNPRGPHVREGSWSTRRPQVRYTQTALRRYAVTV